MRNLSLAALFITVWLHGYGISVSPEAAKTLHLHGGEQITEEMFGQILVENLHAVEREIEAINHNAN